MGAVVRGSTMKCRPLGSVNSATRCSRSRRLLLLGPESLAAFGAGLVGAASGSSWLVLATPSRDSTSRLLEAAVTKGRLLTCSKDGTARVGAARHPKAAYGLSCAMLVHRWRQDNPAYVRCFQSSGPSHLPGYTCIRSCSSECDCSWAVACVICGVSVHMQTFTYVTCWFLGEVLHTLHCADQHKLTIGVT
jgi:hypothetical protein